LLKVVYYMKIPVRNSIELTRLKIEFFCYKIKKKSHLEIAFAFSFKGEDNIYTFHELNKTQ
jgi:hypothetical protein